MSPDSLQTIFAWNQLRIFVRKGHPIPDFSHSASLSRTTHRTDLPTAGAPASHICTPCHKLMSESHDRYGNRNSNQSIYELIIA